MTREEAIEALRYRRNIINNVDIDWCANEIAAIDVVLSALLPVSREQVEKSWRGEWNYSHKTKIDGFDVVQCSKCGQEALTLALYVKNGNFCPYCGAPLTDKAVEMTMKRMKVLRDDN